MKMDFFQYLASLDGGMVSLENEQYRRGRQYDAQRER